MSPSPEIRRRFTLGVAATVAIIAIWALSSWWSTAHRPGVLRALDVVPGDAERVAWTSWSAVVERVGSHGGVQRIMERAYDADLSSTSTLGSSAATLSSFGLKVSDLEWEIFAQADDGAITVLRPDSAEAWLEDLRSAGWRPLEESTGVYDGSDSVARRGLSPQLNYVMRVDELLFFSDDPDYARKVAERDMTDTAEPMRRAAEGLKDPISAVVLQGDYACGHLTMSQADEFDQAQARLLLKRAGGVDPLTAFAMGASAAAQELHAAFVFDNDTVARLNADARATLASGDAPGQGGRFSDRFTLGEVKASGDRVTMEMQALPGQSVLSDLTSGPVLFASC